MLIFFQQLINGITTGTLFALIAIGYTMVYGIIELINFAHGDLFMLGSFLALTLMAWMGLSVGSETPLWALPLLSVPLFVAGWTLTPAFLRKRLSNPPWLAGAASGLGAALLFCLLLRYVPTALAVPSGTPMGGGRAVLAVLFA